MSSVGVASQTSSKDTRDHPCATLNAEYRKNKPENYRFPRRSSSAANTVRNNKQPFAQGLGPTSTVLRRTKVLLSGGKRTLFGNKTFEYRTDILGRNPGWTQTGKNAEDMKRKWPNFTANKQHPDRGA